MKIFNNLFKAKTIEEEMLLEIESSYRAIIAYERQECSASMHINFYKSRINTLKEHINNINNSKNLKPNTKF